MIWCNHFMARPHRPIDARNWREQGCYPPWNRALYGSGWWIPFNHQSTKKNLSQSLRVLYLSLNKADSSQQKTEASHLKGTKIPRMSSCNLRDQRCQARQDSGKDHIQTSGTPRSTWNLRQKLPWQQNPIRQGVRHTGWRVFFEGRLLFAMKGLDMYRASIGVSTWWAKLGTHLLLERVWQGCKRTLRSISITTGDGAKVISQTLPITAELACFLRLFHVCKQGSFKGLETISLQPWIASPWHMPKKHKIQMYIYIHIYRYT